MYQQVLNLRKGVGHPFVEPQLGVGDDGVLTGNFSQKAGIAISNSSHVLGAPPPLLKICSWGSHDGPTINLTLLHY